MLIETMQLADFTWKPHRAGFQAVGLFENGFGVSVIPEHDCQHYEVAVLEHKEGRHSHVSYTSGLTEDVFRFLTVDGVHDVIARVRNIAPGTRIYKEYSE